MADFTDYFDISGSDTTTVAGDSKIATCKKSCVCYFTCGDYTKTYFSSDYSYAVITDGETYINNNRIVIPRDQMVKYVFSVGEILCAKTFTDRSYEHYSTVYAYVA